MSLQPLKDSIQKKAARLAVIGLGYVGLPVACEFARAGFDVLGVEINQERVERINAGVSPVEGDEPGLADLLASVVASGKLRATNDYRRLSDRDIVLIDVETPVGEDHFPSYKALRSAVSSLGPLMKDGALVIVESTIAPGTMNDVVAPLLQESSHRKLNRDFYLGNCPERVMPGKLLANLREMSRVVGGMTPETSETMLVLYRNIVQAELDPVDCVTAELVKTVENAYRDVQIAFANEVALICEAVGGDVWRVRELVNKSPFRQMHLPGAGVGGHCIPKDPWLLAYGVKDKNLELHLIPAARRVNDHMPLHMADLVKEALEREGRRLDQARILVLGYAYLEDSDDSRNSPSAALVDQLRELGAEVVIHDPYISPYQGDLFEKARGCDAIVLMVRHRQYLDLKLAELAAVMRTPLLVDGRKAFNASRVREAGMQYWGVGERR